MRDLKEGPVIQFTDQYELAEYCGYWQSVLHLPEWVIGVSLVDEIIEGGDECAGFNDYTQVHKVSNIRISRSENASTDDSNVRVCQEKTLVHELLHLKLSPLCISGTASFEQKMYEMYEHWNVESLARAFIIARYNLPSDWFINRAAFKIPMCED